MCAHVHANERVLNIHLLHQRFGFLFHVPLCHRACRWMWENLKVTFLTSEKLLFFLIRLIVSVTFFFFFLHHGKSAIKEKKSRIYSDCVFFTLISFHVSQWKRISLCTWPDFLHLFPGLKAKWSVVNIKSQHVKIIMVDGKSWTLWCDVMWWKCIIKWNTWGQQAVYQQLCRFLFAN